MTEAIIVAIIAGVCSIVGACVAARATQLKTQKDIQKSQVETEQNITKSLAVIECKSDRMQQDIKDHNHYARLFAETMPAIKEQIKTINMRLDNLESKGDRT